MIGHLFFYNRLLYFWYFWFFLKDLLRHKKTTNSNKITTAVCCIAKWEDDYIDEFVEHHLKLGFDKIIIYDNNDDFSLCKRYRESDKIITIPYKKKKFAQIKAYHDCMIRFRYKYDWIAIIDVDEFLFIDCPNIKDFLSDFADFTSVAINWDCYGAGGQIYKENKPLSERFTIPGEGDIKHFNSHYKSIVNTHLFFKNRCFFPNPHQVHTRRKSKKQHCIVDDCKNSIVDSYIENPLYVRSRIKHYWSKSWEEYKAKVLRGRANTKINRSFYEFFTVNADLRDNPIILGEIEELEKLNNK